MRDWLIAILVTVAIFLKVFTTGDGETSIAVGSPFLLPFDSPAAACIRAPDEPFIACGLAAIVGFRSSSFTVAKLPRCGWCFDASIAISSFGRGGVTARRQKLEDLAKPAVAHDLRFAVAESDAVEAFIMVTGLTLRRLNCSRRYDASQRCIYVEPDSRWIGAELETISAEDGRLLEIDLTLGRKIWKGQALEDERVRKIVATALAVTLIDDDALAQAARYVEASLRGEKVPHLPTGLAIRARGDDTSAYLHVAKR